MTGFDTIVLGGGMVAGYLARKMAEKKLRQGQLAIIAAEEFLPYERPPLSKGFLAGKMTNPAELLINDEAFYRQHGIEVLLKTEVTGADLRQRRLTLSTGEELAFERLVIATGSRVRRLTVPGADLANIHYLRTAVDSTRIREDATSKPRAVVIGSGFIGLEVAAVLAQRGLEVTLVFPQEHVWPRLFTEEMAQFFEKYYQDRGVRIKPRSEVTAFEGDGRVERVVLASGERLPAELIVAGIGVEPAVDLFKDSGLELHNGVVVNEFLATNLPGIYAAGDVANYYDQLYGVQRRVEHWDNAVSQGEYLGEQLAAVEPASSRQTRGKARPFVHIPYFFSDEFDLSYEFWGDTRGADRTVVRGRLSQGEFSVWWLSEGRLVAAFVLNRPDEERRYAQELIMRRTQVPITSLLDESIPMDRLVA